MGCYWSVQKKLLRSTDFLFNKSFWRLFLVMDLKKKNIASNETIEKYHSSSSLGKRDVFSVVVGVDLRFFRRKNVWDLICVKVKEREGSRLIARLLAWVTAWMILNIRVRKQLILQFVFLYIPFLKRPVL